MSAETVWKDSLKWGVRVLITTWVILMISSFWCDNPIWKRIVGMLVKQEQMQEQIPKEIKKNLEKK